MSNLITKNRLPGILAALLALATATLAVSCRQEYRRVEARKTAATITIDGNPEAAWSNCPYTQIDKMASGELNVEDSLDFSAAHKLLYDQDNLYLLVKVKDSRVFSDRQLSTYMNDGIELHFDVANDKVAHFETGRHFKFTFEFNPSLPYAHERIDGNFTNKKGVQAAFLENPDGYTSEIKIPWTALNLNNSPGKIMGYNINVNDNDSRPADVLIKERESVLSLTENGEHSWQWTNVYANLQF